MIRRDVRARRRQPFAQMVLGWVRGVSRKHRTERIHPLMGNKLYVGNLSYDTTEADLRQAFEADGRHVTEVAIISDRETGRPRGFGFVTMSSAAEAKAAVAALDGTMLQGRNLKVNE